MIEKIKKQSKRQKDILKQIDKVQEPYRVILEKVYILGKSLNEVSLDLKLDYKYTCKKHVIALNKFDNFDENTIKNVELRP